MFKGLQKKFLLLILLLGLLPLLFQGLFTANQTAKVILDNNKVIASQDLEKMAEIDSTRIRSFTNLISYIAEEQGIFDLLLTQDLQYSENSSIPLAAFLKSDYINYAVDYPFEYLFVMEDGQLYTNQPFLSAKNKAWILKHIQDIPEGSFPMDCYSKKIRIGILDKLTSRNYRPSYLYLTSNLFDGSQYIGQAWIGVNANYLWGDLDQAKITPNTNLYITDENDICIMESVQNTISYKEALSGFTGHESGSVISVNRAKQLLLIKEIPLSGIDGGWKIISITPIRDLVINVYKNFILSVILIILAVVGILAISLFMNHYVFTPLRFLQTAMENLVEGDFDVRTDNPGIDEIADLFSGFQYMQKQLKIKMEEIRERESEKKFMEIQMLQAQINPHFICNSLHTIRIMADLNEDIAVSKSLQALNHLVNHYLHNQDSVIPLSEEIDHLHEYLYLQKLRYHNSFSYEIDMAENLNNPGIMKLLLQPLVENCIVHGFSDKSCQGIIRILLCQEDGCLKITIRDNGCGMPPEVLDAFHRKIALPASPGNRIGIENVCKRIFSSYGHPYGISIHNEGGAVVTVLLPLINL